MTTQPPFEYPAVGALLLAPVHLEQVREWLLPADFAHPLCGQLYEQLLIMHAERDPIDPVTVLHQARRAGLLRPDGRPGPQILAMVESVPIPAAAPHYARLVLEDALYRQIAQVGMRLQQVGTDRRGGIEDAFLTVTGQAAALTDLRQRWDRAQPAPRTPPAALSPVPVRRAERTHPARPVRVYQR